MTEHNRIGIGEFVRNTVKLNDVGFEKAMRMDNKDDDINDIEIITLTKDAIELYERS
jgi:hypothetical protein